MTEDRIRIAARAAFDANCTINDLANSDDVFEMEIDEWTAIARAVLSAAQPEADWPLRARVWTRTSVEPHEKVLEITGVIDDVHMTTRHTQSMAIADSDVPGLPEHYPSSELPEDVSTYARTLAETQGVPGMVREADRLVHKIRTAASLYRDGQIKAILAPHDPMEARIAHMTRMADVGALAREIDHLQSRIVTAQQRADPCGKAALVLRTSEEHWDRWDSYEAYSDALTPKD